LVLDAPLILNDFYDGYQRCGSSCRE